MKRRALLLRAAGLAVTGIVGGRFPVIVQEPVPAFGYPMALPGRAAGDGSVARHGYAVENTWFLPGYWHAGGD